MISKKTIPALLIATVLAASASTSAMAHDRDGNNGLAIAAGIIGAVAVGSMIANASAPTYAAPQPQYQPVYEPQYQPVYQAAPQPVYYQPAPVYVRPATVYVRPAPVYVQREYRERRIYREDYRDGYYDR
jgi:hypothetical protein